MRRLSIFLLIGIVVLLAAPVEASVVPTATEKVEVTAQGLKCQQDGCEKTCVTDLFAGQDFLVGTVTVQWNIDGNVYVTYEIAEDDWYMTEVHVGWFDYDELPRKMIPGQAQKGFEDLHDWVYTVTIPQADIGDDCYFGLHAVVEKAYGLEGLEIALPNQVTMYVTYPYTGGPSYFQTFVNGGSVLAGQYDGWCIDTDHTIGNGTVYTANVYSSYEDLPAGTVEHPENLDLVNWILNQGYVGQSSACGGTYTYGDVQRAIWTLVEDANSTSGLGAWSQCRVDEILAAADADGEGFEPECGDVVAVILDPVNAIQITIAQVTLIDVEVPCESQEETAWGWGLIDFTRAWGWFFECCCP